MFNKELKDIVINQSYGYNVNGINGGDGMDTSPDTPAVGQHNVAWALPTWSDSYGELDGSIDGSIFYNFSENLSLGVEAQDLANARYRQLMQQSIGMMTRAVFVSGRRYSASLRYSFATSSGRAASRLTKSAARFF